MVSVTFIVLISLIAAATATLSFLQPNPAYNLAALLLGFYALHLLALRVALRSRRTVERDARLSQLRAELEREKEQLTREREELARQRRAADQQWQLLREMVQDRAAGKRDAVSLGAGVAEGSSEGGPIRGGEDERISTGDTRGRIDRWPAEGGGRIFGRW